MFISKLLTVGSETFQYPEEGTKPGWGEEATDWSIAVSNQLALVSGPNDISCTSAIIANCQCSSVNVGSGASALKFSITAVRSFEVTYNVLRTDPCAVITVESGQMDGVLDCTDWSFSHAHTGCAGVCFTITAAGQIQYTSDSTKGTGTISFRARTIDI